MGANLGLVPCCRLGVSNAAKSAFVGAAACCRLGSEGQGTPSAADRRLACDDRLGAKSTLGRVSPRAADLGVRAVAPVANTDRSSGNCSESDDEVVSTYTGGVLGGSLGGEVVISWLLLV